MKLYEFKREIEKIRDYYCKKRVVNRYIKGKIKLDEKIYIVYSTRNYDCSSFKYTYINSKLFSRPLSKIRKNDLTRIEEFIHPKILEELVNDKKFEIEKERLINL